MERKKSFRDRRDAYYVKPTSSLYTVYTLLAPKRTEAEVFSVEKIEITNLLNYVKEKNKKHPEYHSTMFHGVVTTIFKTLYNRPKMNCFISHCKLYERKNVSVSFIVKSEFSDEGSGRILVLNGDEEMNFDSVSKKICEETKTIREHDTNTIGWMLDVAAKVPKPILACVIFVYKHISSHCWIPKSVWMNDCEFSSVILSNLGSISCGVCYHHLNDYGTNSLMITIGEIYKEYEMDENGKIHERQFVELGVTGDERIADGFYFAKSVSLAKYILSHPELLDDRVSEKVVLGN